MKSVSVSLAGAVLALFMLAGCSPAARTKSAPELPDFEGFWDNLSGFHIDDFTSAAKGDELGSREFRPADPPYNAEYAAQWKVVQESHAQGRPINDPTATCLWPGVPRVIWNPFPVEIVISDQGRRITFLEEYMSQVRRVYADGRGHPEDVEPSYNGHTIGHWEGQTLVMDTVGLREDTMLQNTGMMHSDALQVKERWRLVEPDVLEAEITMIDPKAFTAPYVTRRLYRRHRDWTIQDYVCEENNRERIVDGVTTNFPPKK
ncbi:MAG: hypothetical protein QM696_06030 [Steroidobacteraceae bacterium]